MTRDEFYEKYGEVIVTFSSYYKYTFTYTGPTVDGGHISVGYGGNSDDIYTHHVNGGELITVENLWPHVGTVWDSKGKEIDSFYDY